MGYLGTKPSNSPLTSELIPNSIITNAKINDVAATKLTGTVPDANAPSGSVIQIVSAVTSVVSSTTSTSFVAANLTASITPSSASNRILVILSGGELDCQAGGRQIYVTLYRNNSVNLGTANGLCSLYHDSARSIAPSSASVLDSPSTTSSVSYTVYFRASSGTVQFTSQQSNATLILMEIAA